jgi:hypothetical protein
MKRSIGEWHDLFGKRSYLPLGYNRTDCWESGSVGGSCPYVYKFSGAKLVLPLNTTFDDDADCIMTYWKVSVVPKNKPGSHTKLGTNITNLWAEMRWNMLDQKCDFREDWSFIYYGKYPILILMNEPLSLSIPCYN